MVRVDWNIFKSKFKDGSRQAFEDLSYSVFCHEYGLKTGVFRYRNHPALETEPIQRNGENIGFQAKFFEKKLSECKRDILKAIQAVQDKYPKVSRLVFYLPSDFDCKPRKTGRPRATNMQKEIEAEARATGLTIEWFCLSRFEATLVREEYEAIGKYYFSNETSVYSLIDGLQAQTDLTLATIGTTSSGGGVAFHANRTSFIEKLEKELPDKVCVVHGDGGVGKSGLLKEYAGLFDECIILPPAKVAETLDAIHMKSEWQTDIESLLKTYNLTNRKLFVLDSAEKLENESNPASVLFILNQFKLSGWSIVLTTRSHYRQLLETMLALHLSSPYVFMELFPISEHELSVFAKKYNVRLPEDHLTRDLLRYPFYLDAFLKTCMTDQTLDLSNFKERLWSLIVGGGISGDVASQQFIEIVERHIKTNNYWIDIHGVSDASIKALVDRGVLSVEEGSHRFSIAHDIYEEWALERCIERLYTENSHDEFLGAIIIARPMIRAYRLWLIDKLKRGEDLSELVESALSQDDMWWFDETIIAVMFSPYAGRFLENHRNRLLENEATALRRIVRCVILACRTNNEHSIPIKDGEYEKVFRYYFSQPIGPGWNALVDFLHANKEALHGFDLKDIISLLHDWCIAAPRGITTRKAGELAFDFGQHYHTDDVNGFEVHHADFDKLISTITAASFEIREQIAQFLGVYLDHYSENFVGLAPRLAGAVLEKPMEHLHFITTFPELTCRMAKKLWLRNTCRTSSFDITRIEHQYGLTSQSKYHYFPPGAFMTPMYWLLGVNPVETIDFIVDIVSVAIEQAARNKEFWGITQTTFEFPDGTEVRQYISDAIWSCHRGAIGPSIPYLLQSIHMALEKYLLETHAQHPELAPNLQSLMLEAIRKSKSASIAGVATSLVLAHPNDYFDLASVILTSRAAIRADFNRCKIGEPQCEQLYAISGSRNTIYLDERLATVKDEFRKMSLENVIMWYQVLPQNNLAKRKKRMEYLLDNYSKLIGDEDRFFVSRVDARKGQLFRTTDEKGQVAMGFAPNLPQDLLDKQNATQNELRPNQIAVNLMLWASAKLKGEVIPACCEQYKTDLSKAVSDFKFVLDLLQKDKNSILRPLIAYPAAVFLIYYFNQLDAQDIQTCKDIVLSFASSILDDSYRFQIDDGYSASIVALPTIVFKGNQAEQKRAVYLLLVAMLNENEISPVQRICDLVFDAIRWFDLKQDHFCQKFISEYITLQGMFQQYVNKKPNGLRRCGNPISQFCHEMEDKIVSTISGNQIDTLAIKEALANPFQFIGVLNSVLLIGDKAESVSDNFDLIIDTITPALSFFYHVDEKGHKLSSDRVSPLAFQYQKQLVRLLFAMNDAAREAALKEIQKVPLIFADDYLLTIIVITADCNGLKDIFWDIWEKLFEPLRKSIFDNVLSWRGTGDLLSTFLLGSRLWKQGVHQWRYFDQRGIDLFERVSQTFPPSVPLALGFSSFAYSIGRQYWRKCLRWISKAISFDEASLSYRFEGNLEILVSLLESVMCNLIAEHRSEIRKNPEICNQAFAILDFLVSRYSTVGYRLREMLT